jgi:squalene-hopene/tetraprenyl-beta-curcumene cyclase
VSVVERRAEAEFSHEEVAATQATTVDEARVRAALGIARQGLLRHRNPQGWLKGELETNVTIDAEDLLLREFLGIRGDEETAATAQWIRSKQAGDGTWATFFGGPPDLSTTVEAYVALRLAGDPPEAPHLQRAAAAVREMGGIESTRVFTRLWLALFGLWPWEELPVMPPEMILLPKWCPLNIYDFACWARQTIVALTVVGSHQPAVGFPFAIDELRSGRSAAPTRGWLATLASLRRWGGRFETLDRALHVYQRRPVGWLRRLSLSRAEAWILKRQEADGSWGGIQPPWVYSLIALRLQGYPLDHPVMRAALDGLDSFIVEDEQGRRLEACQSPVWDTALALLALADAGLVDDEVLPSTTDWLLGEEIRVPGDWTVRRPELAPGGWAFEFANDNYPDIDDTAVVVLALARAGLADHPAVARGIDWILGMQCSDGGWGAFDVDNTRTLCRELPFCDFGELIDPPSADVTAHVVEMLADVGAAQAGAATSAAAGVAWLLRAQESDGSWFGRWGANYVYGTGAVLPALAAAGVSPASASVRRAVEWLETHQNGDGGWGEDMRSYRDVGWHGRGTSTPSQTAWALLGLVAAGEATSATVSRGIEYLIATQDVDGTWDEPEFTGTGFPGDFYINYHLYRLVFPMMALGRWLGANSESGAGSGGGAGVLLRGVRHA